jgi:hypothetical protein
VPCSIRRHKFADHRRRHRDIVGAARQRTDLPRSRSHGGSDRRCIAGAATDSEVDSGREHMNANVGRIHIHVCIATDIHDVSFGREHPPGPRCISAQPQGAAEIGDLNASNYKTAYVWSNKWRSVS